MKKYYEAYENRYQAVHQKGYQWSSSLPTPIVKETMTKYGIGRDASILEEGCGEGRDAGSLLQEGYMVTAADLSPSAIAYCQKTYPAHAEKFIVLDCLYGHHPCRYDFIYAVAFLHMLVVDEDRSAFYRFLHEHLKDDGLALIFSMGDGVMTRRTDPRTAFVCQERETAMGKVMVAATTCRMVSWEELETEIRENGFVIVEKGLTESLPDFNSLMYAVLQKAI
ncbi:MAG: class I SAM-dependent methyltransferase [Solobacterium sp.]|nr:class I SAM-dependent methyltransferase [Solobacterium sp.]